MVLFPKLLTFLAGACLTGSAVASATQNAILEDALQGKVIAADDLLETLELLDPGQTSSLLEEIQTSLSTSPNSNVSTLLERVESLPKLIIAERANVPADSKDTAIWPQGTRVGLEVIGAIGNQASIKLLPGLMTIVGLPSEQDRARNERGLEITINAVLARHSDSFESMVWLYGNLPEWCVSALLSSLANTRELAALHTLPKLLGKRPFLDASVLTQIASVARYARAPLSYSALDRIRSYLSSTQTRQRQRSAQALGFLDDTDSAGELIELLNDPEKTVRQASYSALRLITAMTMDPDYRRWVLWHERETNWWHQESAPHLSFLRKHNTKGLVVALRELGQRRLFRKEIAPWILPMLESNNDGKVRVAISALTSLRANDDQTLAALEELLTHADASIRNQAGDSLRVITHRVFLPRTDSKPRPR